ncbi:MAG TPA: LLM class F420-dependent oxidoreductase [Dehalococcoidia bacterium]|jgi:probable F420-dependent oxidoreductase
MPGGSVRPFRFGASVWRAGSRAEWVAKARKLEDLGFSTLLIADHLVEDLPPPFVPLIAAAEATSRLRVGTLVLNNDFRHPLLVARDAASVDLLTEGRLELGIGAGHARSEYIRTGLPFDPFPVRAARLAESVMIVDRLLAGELVSFSGEHYRLEEQRIYPTPVQRPRPPLLVGGNSRAVLTLAARQAEIVGFTGFGQTRAERVVPSGFTAAATAERIGWVREAAGARFDRLELNALLQAVVVTDDREAAAASLNERLPALSSAEILDSPYLLLGTVEQMVEALRCRRERFGFSYYVVFEPAIDVLAPVVARLAGS